MSFLGLTNFSRHFIRDYAAQTAPFRHIKKHAGVHHTQAKLVWTPQAEEAFGHLKQQLATAAALSKPDYTSTFFLDIAEKTNRALACLFQLRQGERHVLGYYSIIRDPIRAKTTSMHQIYGSAG